MSAPLRLTILGSTGSIGRQTLDVIAAFPDHFSVVGLACQHNTLLLEKQAQLFKAKAVCITDNEAAKKYCGESTLYKEASGLLDLLDIPTDIVVFAIHGCIALKAAEKALLLGYDIALANKEILVAAGDLLCPLARKNKVSFLPLDSEHSALQQLISKQNKANLKKITLTASGGPFWQKDIKTFKHIRPQSALKHPSWKMGQKITIDSATLLNKGFEIIEAHHLFDIDYSFIDAIIHPQSIIHALVETIDGSITCHMGPADMRYPIQYALFKEKRMAKQWQSFDISKLQNLNFYPIPIEKFPLFNLAIEAGKKKGAFPAILTAANDIAVEKFLINRISFNQIFSCIEDCMHKFNKTELLNIDEVIELDHHVKEYARSKY